MDKNYKKTMIKDEYISSYVEDDFPTGEIRYTLRNDYMFKAVLQKNKRALAGLLSALLSMPAEKIVDIEIMNPIELGETIDDKTCILDIKLILNNNKIINIELQVTKYEFWIERSLIYLCRAFDNLSVGEDYGNVLPTYHIGILDFWMPDKAKEFYSEYRLMNVRNQEFYSDKIGVNVLNLKAVDNDFVTKEPEELYEWAKLFKATTWEEIRMLAEKNEYIADTVVTLRKLTADEKIRMQCQAREDYEHDRATLLRQGREEGRKEGEIKYLITMICRKLRKGKKLREIADDLEEKEKDLRDMYEFAITFAPEYDEKKMFVEYMKKVNRE